MRRDTQKRSLTGDLTRGALAGLVATWAMDQVTSSLYQYESDEARTAEQDARGGKTAYGVAAEKAAEIAGQHLSEEQRKAAGQKIHWALGIGAGAAYGVLRARCPNTDWSGGVPFGTGFFVLMDEVATPSLGLTPGPTSFPWETHARGLAGHLVYGLVADQLLDLME